MLDIKYICGFRIDQDDLLDIRVTSEIVFATEVNVVEGYVVKDKLLVKTPLWLLVR